MADVKEAAVRSPSGSSPRNPRMRRRLTKWMFMAPLVGLFAVFFAYPFGYSVWISFTNLTITKPGQTRFVGIDQYLSLASNNTYIDSLRNTFLFVIGAVGLELVIGMVIAMALYRQRWLKNATRAVLLTPMFVTPIAVGLMFRFLLNQQLGLIPRLLTVFGVTIDFFGPRLALVSIVLIDVWQWTPLMILMLLAGLQSLPAEPYEAARVDGADAWFTFRNVTLPLLKPVIVVAVIIRALDAFKVFEYVFAITKGGPGTATETIQYQVYKTGFQFFRLGEAAAMALVLVVIVLLIVVVGYRRMVPR